jgi:hypothetical protein
MNQDMSKTLHSPEFYYEARDIRVVTENGLSTGDAENEKGNTLVFTIPATVFLRFVDTPTGTIAIGALNVNGFTNNVALNYTTPEDFVTAVTTDPGFATLNLQGFYLEEGAIFYSTTTDITSFNDPQGWFQTNRIEQSRFIGEGKIRQDIYLLTTASQTYAPDNTSFIWKFVYTQDDAGIITPTISLIYGEQFGLSEEYPIGDEVIGRFESPEIQKLYWVDGKANLRFINTAVDNQGLNSNILESSPEISSPVISIDSVDIGGALDSGIVQYAYQAANSQGGISSLSPLSITIHLTDSAEGATTNQYYGQPQGNDSGKSVTLSVSGIDGQFTVIQFYRIHFKDSINVPIIDVIAQTQLADGEASITDDGNITLGGLSLNDFTSLVNLDLIPQTIAAKDDRLFQGNIQEPGFDVDFDARAYRYNSLAAGATTYVSLPAGAEEDAINPLNTNFSAFIPDAANYIYQSDGTTIGGEGPNVSYTIEDIDIRLDNDNYTDFDGSTTHEAQQRRLNIDNQGPNFMNPNNPYSQSFSSPLMSGDRRGYKRNEVYRFGLKFVTTKGISSFVRWIGDIKMPSCADGFPITTKAGSGGDVLGKTLFVRFTINNIPAIEDLDYIEIVRVERTDKDKTILGQGMLTSTMTFNRPAFTEPDLRILPYALSASEMVNGTIQGQYVGGVGATIKPRLVEFISPENLLTDSIDFRDGDLIRYQTLTLGWTRNTGDPETDTAFQQVRNAPSVSPTADRDINFVAKGRYSLTFIENHPDIQTEINSATKTYANKGLELTVGNDVIKNLVEIEPNEFPAVSQYTQNIAGRGNSKIFLDIAKDITAQSWLTQPADHTTVDNPIGPVNNDGFIIGDYKRPRIAQYGGATYEARSVNTYISTNARAYVTGTSAVLDTYGGDTFVGYYDYLRVSADDFTDLTPFFAQEILYIPLETSVNLHLRHDRSFHNLAIKNRDVYKPLQESLELAQAQPTIADRLDEEATDLYLYNQTYSRQSNIINSFPEPLVINLAEQFDTRTRYSLPKIDNETFDSWTQFLTDNVNNVDNTYGPITKLINFNDEIFFVQDTGFGQWRVNPRVQTTASDGEPLELGVGGVLHDYSYYSTKFGTNQKFGVITSERNLYFLDPRTDKLIQTGQGSGSISDILGMYSFLRNNLNNELRDASNPFLGQGITTSYDRRFNEILFTVKQQGNNYTIGFNELTNTFTQFYNYTPSLYTEHSNNLFSINPDRRSLYVHHFGDRGVYYDQAPVESSVTILINPQADLTKVFNNIELYSQMFDSTGQEIFDETISAVRFYNDYQDSGKITLTNNANLRRRMRKWRMNVFRDDKARMRNPYLFVTLFFQNNNNKRLVLHHLLTYFQVRPNN